jgi:hypothetical protein
MDQLNYRTYQLLKEDKVIEETQAATFDRAIDYFIDRHPEAYSDTSYQFKYVRMSHEL